jgi:hypothetical protein
MTGLVPGIHVFPSIETQDVDGRDKPWTSPAMTILRII